MGPSHSPGGSYTFNRSPMASGMRVLMRTIGLDSPVSVAAWAVASYMAYTMWVKPDLQVNAERKINQTSTSR